MHLLIMLSVNGEYKMANDQRNIMKMKQKNRGRDLLVFIQYHLEQPLTIVRDCAEQLGKEVNGLNLNSAFLPTLGALH